MTWLTTLCGGAAVGAALATGVYANFSARVMPRLSRRPVAEAIDTMQRFNARALRAPFMTVFFGSAALSAAAAIVAVHTQRSAGLACLGAGLYWSGFLLTVGYNVPRNERLARVAPDAPQSGPEWSRYQREWTRANSLRAWLSLASTGCLAAAAKLGLRG